MINTTNSSITIHWFRQDLRLSDNPALTRAAALGTVLPVYILDDETAGEYAMGGASRWWLHHSLTALSKDLGGNLNCYRGNAQTILKDIARRYQVTAICWNRCYEPWRVRQDTGIKEVLKQDGFNVESFNGALLWEPWEVRKENGTSYKVFTPFYRKGCRNAPMPRRPLAKPRVLNTLYDPDALKPSALNLLPSVNWYRQLEPHWNVGECSAQDCLRMFLDEKMADYKEGRNFPAKSYASRLSPYLHFGEISPNQIWHAVQMRGEDANTDCFCSELGWREFSYHLLYQFPALPYKNLQSKFDYFPWKNNPEALRQWQRGYTGYPIVDAGMRELWQTGYMHNRVRMVVASFLIKNLRIDWRDGARWFWDCLVDADLANNSASWQWVAGSGADAAPYFRIFNPVTQGQKFDPDGAYTRRFVPELKHLPDKYLFNPWKAPESALMQAGVVLGENYPMPIVDVAESRLAALQAFKNL